MTNSAPPAPPEQTRTSPPVGLRRRWLLNAGLLVVIGALAWLAIYRAGQPKGPVEPPLTTLSAAAVAHVNIERPQTAITLEKEGANWMLTAPVRARANRFNVENLLRVLSAPAGTRFPAVATELAKFGLDKPQSRVRFENDEIAFGSMHPLNNQVYVLHQNQVALIPAQYLAGALYPYSNYIDGHLFEEDRQITEIKLPKFVLARKNGTWVKQPPDKKLTSDQINDFASEWQNASALSVEKYSGKKALDRIEVSSTRNGKENEKISLNILGYKPDFILQRPDENLEYHFTEETGKRLLELEARDEESGNGK